MKFSKITLFFFLTFIIPFGLKAQFSPKFSQATIAISNIQYGVPFQRMLPIHPGIELGATFFRKENEKNGQRISAQIGFFHHNLITNATYLKGTYAYQFKVKDLIGLDLQGSLGYMHAFSPGETYFFNQKTETYEKGISHQAFFVTNLGFGLSYIQSEKFQPFVRYEMNLSNFNFIYLLSSLQIGFAYNLH